MSVALLVFNGWAVVSLLLRALDGWLTGDSLRNLSVVLAILGLVGPPLWLSRRMSRKRLWFGRYLLLFNLLMAGVLFWQRARLVPPPAPTVTPVVAVHTPELQPVASETPVATRTPVALETPEVVVTPEVVETPAPVFSDSKEADRKYASIDEHALAAPVAMERDVATLARYLVGPARNDEEKMRAIYRWVTDRIAYDAEAFYANDLPDSAPEVTLRRRSAVCGGYAELVEALAKAAGLKTELISGYANGSGTDPDEKQNHAWNAIKLPQGWRLLDATWGAGGLGEDRKFHKEFSSYFFLTPADQMLVTHFPTESKWQLVLPAISRAEFMKRPKRMPEFYQLGLKVDELVGELEASPRATIHFSAPPGLYLSAQLQSKNSHEEEHTTMVDRDGGRIVVDVLAPRPGKYRLLIFAFPPGGESGSAVLEYSIVSKAGQAEGYPETYHAFQQHSGHVFSPNMGTLKAGKQHFELELSGAESVFVNDWDNELVKEGDRFAGDVEVSAGDVKIYAVFGGERGEGIVSYQVR